MKRYCKEVDITSFDFILNAICACLLKRKKRLRPDTIKLFSNVSGLSKTKARDILINTDERYYAILKKIAKRMQNELIERNITLPAIIIKRRLDGNSGKIRKISVLHVWQLLYDHVAVFAMQELNRLMGEHQVSGRKGMGSAAGFKFMKRWMRLAGRTKMYFVKLDITKYYESVNIQVLLTWLGRRIKNEKLMWLIQSLLQSGDEGLNIGSYLSHFLANLYLSDVWHKIKLSNLCVWQALYYMDDMLLISTNKRKLKQAVLYTEVLLLEKGLHIKNKWQIHRWTDSRPIDIMGYRFGRTKVTLRKRIFKRARRICIRIERSVRKHMPVHIKHANRLISYNGWVKNINCKHIIKKLKFNKFLKMSISARSHFS